MGGCSGGTLTTARDQKTQGGEKKKKQKRKIKKYKKGEKKPHRVEDKTPP